MNNLTRRLEAENLRADPIFMNLCASVWQSPSSFFGESATAAAHSKTKLSEVTNN